MSRCRAAVSALTILVAATIASAQAPDNGPARQELREAAQYLDGAAYWQISLCGDIAELYRRLGDAKEAADVIDKMREKLKAQPSKIGSAYGPGHYEASVFSKAYARLGNAKAAIEVSTRVESKDVLLQESALEAVKAGHVEAAYQIADAIADADSKSQLKANIREDIVIRRVQTGGAAEALRAADQLPTALAKVNMLVGHEKGVFLSWDSSRDTDLFRDGIASLQFKAGNKAAAKETALRALALLPSVEEAQRARAALAVVWLLAELDDLAPARKALALMPREGDPKRVLELNAKGCIAAAEVRTGRDEAALAALREFDNPRQQAYLLHIAALAQARAGRKEAAKANFIRAVNLVTGDPAKPGDAGTTMRNIAVAEALAGDFAAAVQHAKESPAFGHALALVAELQAQSGDFAGARKTAEYAKRIRARPTENAMDAFRSVARAQAKAGQAVAVRAWAEQEMGALRAYLLAGLAEGLLMPGGKKP